MDLESAEVQTVLAHMKMKKMIDANHDILNRVYDTQMNDMLQKLDAEKTRLMSWSPHEAFDATASAALFEQFEKLYARCNAVLSVAKDGS